MHDVTCDWKYLNITNTQRESDIWSSCCFLVYGNDVIGEFGQIASPLYPRTYPNNAYYRWTITVAGDSYIQIRFLDMDIEDLMDCYYDNLKVRKRKKEIHLCSWFRCHWQVNVEHYANISELLMMSPGIWWPQCLLLSPRDILWSGSSRSHKKFQQHCHAAVPVWCSGEWKRLPPGMDCHPGNRTTTHYHTR